jgi:hypothetical protein
VRVQWAAGSVLLFGAAAVCPAANPTRIDRPVTPSLPALRPILRAASELALQQPDSERFWTDRVVLRISQLQTRAGDFDGAIHSVRHVKDQFQRGKGMSELVEALARAGQRKRAIEVSRLLDTGSWWTPERRDDVIQGAWIEYLIEAGDLRAAGQAVELLKTGQMRREGFQRLGVACAWSGDAASAATHFSHAIEAGASLKDERDRAVALSRIAGAQQSVGIADSVAETIRRLAKDAATFKNPRAEIIALREGAALAARLKDRKTAQDMFGRAVERCGALDGSDRRMATASIATTQARTGYIDDAIKTAWRIEHDDLDFSVDADREEALCAVAVAQVAAGDADGAVKTALSITHFVQYRDDALNAVVGLHNAKREFKAALVAANKFENASSKAAAILRVATAQALAGDREGAAVVAANIKLTRQRLLQNVVEPTFDFNRPTSWGICYDSGIVFTMASHQMSVRRAADVAGAAMGLAHVRRPF